MRSAIQLTADDGLWPELVQFVTAAETMGVDMCWVAEAWGSDAATPLGFLAARTERIILGSGVFQLGVRSPAMTIRTALTLATLTDERFVLGLGVSGPQVIEGLHGVPFEKPLRRMTEFLDLLSLALSGSRLEYHGSTMTVPIGGHRPFRLTREPVHIPVWIAAVSPRMLELTGQRADGWLGTSFVPEAAESSIASLRRGATAAGRSLEDIDLCQGAEVAFARDETEVVSMLAERKHGLAFTLGGMGSPDTNFYNDAYARQGFAEVAEESRRLWLDGHHERAAEVIPDAMVLATTLIGTEDMVASRLLDWERAGITTVRLYPAGKTLSDRLDTLERALDLLPR